MHDHPLFFVWPDLLVKVGETSYRIRGGSLSNYLNLDVYDDDGYNYFPIL
jgi:hypothetical protein